MKLPQPKIIYSKYNVMFVERGLGVQRAEDFFAGNQHLSDSLLNETINFKPQHNFSTWLNKQ